MMKLKQSKNYKYNVKKVMRKVKKNWVFVSVVAFALLGMSGYVQNNVFMVHADTVQQSQTQVKTGKWGDANVSLSSDGTLTVASGDNGSVLGSNFPFNKDDVKKIVFINTVKLPTASTRLLADFHNVTEMDGLDKIDASQLVYADGLFVEDHNLQSIDISSWKTPNLTNAFEMFAGNHRITSINVTGLDTSNVTDMSEMFAHDYNLTNIIGLNTFNTENVTNFNYFLGWATSLKNVDLSNFKTPKVVTMDHMFINTPQLTSVNLANWDTSHIENVSSAFDFQIGSNDDAYPYNDKQYLVKSNLQSITTGVKFDPKKITFDSVVGKVNLYRLNDDGTLSLDGEPSDKWGAASVSIVNKNNQALAKALVVQGAIGQNININIPDGYGTIGDNGTSIVLKPGNNGQIVIKVYKKQAVTIKLVDQSDDSVKVYQSIPFLDTQSIDISKLVPSGYRLVDASKSALTPNDDNQTYTIFIAKDEDNNSSSNNTNHTNSNVPISDQTNDSKKHTSVDEHQNNAGRPVSSDKVTKNMNEKNNKKNNDKDAKLPQTGESNQFKIQVAGMISIILGIALLGLKRIKKNR